MAVRGSYFPFKNTDQVQMHHTISHTVNRTPRTAPSARVTHRPAEHCAHAGAWKLSGLGCRHLN